jgi:hypothetical protein
MIRGHGSLQDLSILFVRDEGNNRAFDEIYDRVVLGLGRVRVIRCVLFKLIEACSQTRTQAQY